MNDRVTDEQQKQRIVPQIGKPSETHRVDSLGIGVRIDPAHSYSESTEAKEVAWQQFDHFVPAGPARQSEPPRPVIARPAATPAPEDDLMLEDWSLRIRRSQEQLKAQKSSLELREQEFQKRLLEFEEERDLFSQRAAKEQAQLDARKTQLKKEATDLADRFLSFEQQARKFDAESQQAHIQRVELERRKVTLKEEILAELHAERNEIAAAQAILQKEFDQAAALKETLQQRLGALTTDNDRALKAEREKLWQSLTEEWELRRVSFEHEQQEWARTRELEKTEIDRERAMLEAAMQSANEEFIRSREVLTEELAEQRLQHTNRLDRERQEWEELRKSEEALLLARLDSQQNEFQSQLQELAADIETKRNESARAIRTEREAWEQAKQQQEQELVRLREALQLEVQSVREQHGAALQVDLEQHEAAIQAKYEELKASLLQRQEQQDADLFAQQSAWKHAYDRDLAELELRREEVRQELVAARAQHEASLQNERAEWESYREHQKTVLAAQLQEILSLRDASDVQLRAAKEEHVSKLSEERAEWETREAELRSLCHALEQEMVAKREQLDQELIVERTRHAQELIAERQQHDQELLSERQQHNEELAAERRQHNHDLVAERQEWDQIRESEKTEHESQYADWMATRDASLAASREALEYEFVELRKQHAAQLQAEREAFEEYCQRESTALTERQTEFARERTLVENRIRFQQDHLDKSRLDFEQSQNEARRERQVEHQRLEEINFAALQRLKQIELYRESIDAREKSLDREQEVLTRTRKAISSTADFDRLNFQAEKQAWEQERQIQQNEMRRQQEALAVKSESLESRRIRLDKLRAELEETHRATLEMRLAVEESWAQLTHSSGQDEARKRVELARQSLAGYYEQMHESLSGLRKELMEAQTKFERQRAEFADERQKLTSWITKRDEELIVGEERLRIAANEASSNHAKWLTARDRWLLEKTEAEQLIRRLLTSLGDNNRDQSTHHEALSRLDEIHIPFETGFAHRA